VGNARVSKRPVTEAKPKSEPFLRLIINRLREHILSRTVPPMAKQSGSADKELKAIGAILTALDKLDGESIQRVLDYVFGRLSLSNRPTVATVTKVAAAQTHSPDSAAPSRRPSIRDLKDEKRPESSNQMAALVAYYLSEVVDQSEYKESINANDLEKYFKQAGFKLPKTLQQTLPNATAAGYFDSVGNGYYKLNPVGYNLVVHGLPRTHLGSEKKPRRLRRKRTGKGK
jgi:hypothetical protein